MFSSEGRTINNNIVEGSQQGITLASSNNNTISDNIITNNTQQGIAFSNSLGNTVSDNVITANSQGGIDLIASSNNLFSGNVISNNYGNNGGIYMYASGGNVFSGNTFANNSAGETISPYCYQNIFYHNNFFEAFQVSISSPSNIWDHGGEGNYWSSYAGHNRGDGIGIESYTVAPYNRDNHPLMGEFSSFSATSQYGVQTVCNSTITDFQFNGTAISFNASGENGTTGFCRICIPTTLINGTFTVFVNGTEVPYTLLPESTSTNSYLYFTYHHSTQEIIIAPEFPSFLILSLFLIATLLTAMIYKKRPTRTT
jgi:parallel beta-helix repeat protein